MSYRELVAELAREHAEELSDALMELGALSVSVEDAGCRHARRTAAVRRARSHAGSHRVATFTRDRAVRRRNTIRRCCSTAAANEVGLDAAPSFTVREVEEQDWVRLTQSQFDPIQIGERIWVVPSWHDAPDPEALVLELDPGLAFGTGSHPTTRLCMEWLEQSVKPEQSVLDYGCGSGILAILAKKCGANPVYGIDIDPQAVESARHNSERNRAEVTYGLPDACPTGEFDIVVANILSNPLEADGIDAVVEGQAGWSDRVVRHSGAASG